MLLLIELVMSYIILAESRLMDYKGFKTYFITKIRRIMSSESILTVSMFYVFTRIWNECSILSDSINNFLLVRPILIWYVYMLFKVMEAAILNGYIRTSNFSPDPLRLELEKFYCISPWSWKSTYSTLLVLFSIYIKMIKRHSFIA